ncbi:MAG TPA: PEP/pyruvate-binding domain-containing protein [Streptosporangiaceae bacterium]
MGAKAATLARLAQAGFPVANGFCVTTAVHRHWAREGSLDISDSALLSCMSLAGVSFDRNSLIARTSALEESQPRHLFAGLFASVADVRSLRALRDSVEECFQSVRRREVADYCRFNDLDPAALSLACLVQEQLSAVWSGVAFTNPPLPGGSVAADGVLMEVSEGHLGKMLGGGPVAQAFLAQPQADGFSVSQFGHAPQSQRLAPGELLADVATLAVDVRNELGQDQDIEWLFDGKVLYLLQARPHITTAPAAPDHGLAIRRGEEEISGEILPDEAEIGLKGAAMEFFHQNGLFTKPVLFIHPGTDSEEARDAILATDFGSGGITVRYSYRNAVGLPRFFVSDRNQAAKEFLHKWHPEWFGIIHGYITVRESFELYVADDHFVLEHVPGLWESDSTLVPDVIVSRDGVIHALRYVGTRSAKFEEPQAVYFEDYAPITMDDIAGWTACATRAQEVISKLGSRNLPLICHFVQDEDGSFSFLNLRRTVVASSKYAAKGTFHVVSSVSDMDSWNGISRILLRLSVERGSEESLSKLAMRLPRREGLVYIDFGLLSHPAIVLREFGVQLRPAYLTHEKIEIGKA